MTDLERLQGTWRQTLGMSHEALADLICSEEFRSGIYAFDLVQRRAKRPAGVPDSTTRPELPLTDP